MSIAKFFRRASWLTSSVIWLSFALTLPSGAASPQDEARALFERFVAAQNAHDIHAVEGMLWNSPNFLWISRGKQIWGNTDATALYQSYYSGTWHLDPDMAAFRATVLADGVVQILVPVEFTRGAPGQPAQRARFLISQSILYDAGGWHIATIVPVVDTQLK